MKAFADAKNFWMGPALGAGIWLAAGCLGAQNLHPFPAVNGPVYAIAPTSGIVYLGGAFTEAGTRAPNLGLVDGFNGNVTPGFPETDGPVYAVVADGCGGWFVGGTFGHIGGVPRSGLAHVLINMTVDPAWNPGLISGSFGFPFGSGYPTVACLALSGNTLYIGGGLMYVNGSTRYGLAALDRGTAALEPWDPNLLGGYPSVILPDGPVVWVGGSFETVNGGVSRNFLAGFDSATGVVTGWDGGLGPSGFSPFIEVKALALDGTTLYAGGNFQTVNSGTPRPYLAALDKTTALDTGWAPEPDADVSALAVKGGRLYAAGEFITLQGGALPREHLAAFDLPAGTVTSWNPRLLTDGLGDFTLVLSPPTALSVLYLGGPVTQVLMGPFTYYRQGLVAFELTGGYPTLWNPRAGLVSHDRDLSGSSTTIFSHVNALAVDNLGGGVCLGGDFYMLNSVSRNHLAAFYPSNGQLTSWNPATNGDVWCLAASPTGTIYAGGAFTSTGPVGIPRNRLAAFNPISGSLTAWNPDVNDVPYALAMAGSDVVAGGDFTTVNGGLPRNRLAAFNPTTGTVTAWDPDANATVRALAQGAGVLYAGGAFTTLNGGVTRTRLASFDWPSGALRSFSPDVSGNTVMALSLSGGELYLGGIFSQVDGTRRWNGAAFDTATETLAVWDPSISGNSCFICGAPPFFINQNGVYALAAGTGGLYTGGQFTAVNDFNSVSVPRNRLASLDSVVGAVTGWDPGLVGNYLYYFTPMGGPFSYDISRVWAMAAVGDRVYLGGERIHSILGRRAPFFAALSGSGAPPPSPTPTYDIWTSACWTDTPTATSTPTLTATFTPTPSPSPTAMVTDTATPTVSPSPSPSPTPPPCPPGYTGPNPPEPGTCFTYPAPASGDRVRFAYFLRQVGRASIRVWNERGDLAASLEGGQGCGAQEAALDIRRFASGIYFYRVTLKYGGGGEEKLKTQKFMVRR